MSKLALKQCTDLLANLTADELEELGRRVNDKRTPDTSDFCDADWEDVDRLHGSDGVDYVDAVRQTRASRDDAIAHGEIDENGGYA